MMKMRTTRRLFVGVVALFLALSSVLMYSRSVHNSHIVLQQSIDYVEIRKSLENWINPDNLSVVARDRQSPADWLGRPERVSRKKKVFFLKMHKAASSTITSILSYWGLKNNMTFALPKNTHQYWPKKFDINDMMPLKKAPDIFMSHVQDSASIDRLMPKSEAVYFTAVRDPVTLLESAFNYFNLNKCTGHEFNSFFIDGYYQSGIKSSCEFRKLHNVMMLDMGLQDRQTDDRQIVQKIIQQADRRFDFVIITERFEECLILLRDLLGATTDDIAVLKNNFRKETYKVPIDNQTRSIIEHWNWADKMLYDHFRNKTYTLLDQNRDYIAAELVKLKAAEQKLQEFCVAKTSDRSDTIASMKPYGHGTQGYTLTAEGQKSQTCILKSAPETTTVNMIRLRQTQDWVDVGKLSSYDHDMLTWN